MSRPLLVLQHAGCEPPGVYEAVLREREIAFERVVLDEAPSLPDWRTASARSSRWAGRWAPTRRTPIPGCSTRSA